MISLVLAAAIVLATPTPIAAEEVIEQPKVVETVDSLSDTDAELVARIVMSEARGECYEGQKAVAQVIYNRASLWSMTIEEVCYAKGQFANPYKGEVTEDVWRAVNDAYYDCDSLYNATHFSSNGVSWGKELVAEIGCHRFYR